MYADLSELLNITTFKKIYKHNCFIYSLEIELNFKKYTIFSLVNYVSE